MLDDFSRVRTGTLEILVKVLEFEFFMDWLFSILVA